MNKIKDEYYTTELCAYEILERFGYLLKGKKVILPCDTEESELYKECKRRGIECYISQDMWGTDYSQYDLVFTNPPFSCATKWCKWLEDNGIKFISFVPWTFIYHITEKEYKAKYLNKIYYIFDAGGNNDIQNFNLPNGEVGKIKFGLVTNLEEGRSIVESKPAFREHEGETYKGLVYDMCRCNYLPYDFSFKRTIYMK